MPLAWVLAPVLIALWAGAVLLLWRWRNEDPDAPDSYEQTRFRRRTGFWIWTVALGLLLIDVLGWVNSRWG